MKILILDEVEKDLVDGFWFYERQSEDLRIISSIRGLQAWIPCIYLIARGN